MKAILEFNLNDEDDAISHIRCVKALDMALAMWNFSSELSKIYDQSEDGRYIDERLVRNAWQDTLETYGINLDSLVR